MLQNLLVKCKQHGEMQKVSFVANLSSRGLPRAVIKRAELRVLWRNDHSGHQAPNRQPERQIPPESDLLRLGGESALLLNPSLQIHQARVHLLKLRNVSLVSITGEPVDHGP